MKLLITLNAFVFALMLRLSAQPAFVDATLTDGIVSNGYSLSVVDLDKDGYDDIYVGIKNQANKFYHNNGDGTFTNIAPQLGIDDPGNTYTAVWADFDNDGDADLYVGNWDQPNTFYLNLGDAGFIEVGAQLGINNTGRCRSVAVGDANNDGWLDLYVVNISQANAFYMNNKQGGFTDHYIASQALDNLIGMGSVFFDSDNDGDSDLYLLHDAYQANRLYINNGNAVFSNQAVALGAAVQGEGMGVDVTDVNHDGWPDIYITNNTDGNALLLNDGDGSYTEVGDLAGVSDIGMGWGVAWIDYNLDGEKDIYIANNYGFSPILNVLYHNNGDGTFSKVGQGTALDSPYAGAAIAIADFDRNGKEDIAIANPISATSPGVQILMNETEGGNFIGFTFEGAVSNRDGVGAVIDVWSAGHYQRDYHLGNSGYSQQNSARMLMGVGNAPLVDSIMVHWPSGIVDVYHELPINTFVHFTEGETVDQVNTDITGDLGYDITDLLSFLTAFGCTVGCNEGDVNSDGLVNSTDLLFLLTSLSGG